MLPKLGFGNSLDQKDAPKPTEALVGEHSGLNTRIHYSWVKWSHLWLPKNIEICCCLIHLQRTCFFFCQQLLNRVVLSVGVCYICRHLIFSFAFLPNVCGYYDRFWIVGILACNLGITISLLLWVTLIFWILYSRKVNSEFDHSTFLQSLHDLSI